MKVRYFVLKQKNPYSQIYVRFWDGRRYDFKTSTGMQVNFKDWNAKDEKVKNKVSATDKDFTNKKLLELKTYLLETYNIEYNGGEAIGKDWLKQKINIFFKRVDNSQPEKIFFVEWIKKFVANAPNRLNRGKQLSHRTILAYKTVLNHILQYETFKKINLRHSDITLSFYWDFVSSYCRTEQKLSENTIGNIIKYIKFFCGAIDFEGLPISKDYKHKEFVKPTEETLDIYLTTTEIEKVFNHDFSDTPYLDNTRDLFIIGLNTGLRVSDFMRLDLSYIKDDTIRINAKKTGAYAEIPINYQIEKTLQKNGGKLPRSISEQKFNKYVKEVCKIVGFTEMTKGSKDICINEEEAKNKGIKKIFRKSIGDYPKYELVASHICRRSFSTNLYGQIATPVIMSITGHKTEEQFLKYIKRTKAENAEILRNFYKRSAEEKGLKPNLKIV